MNSRLTAISLVLKALDPELLIDDSSPLDIRSDKSYDIFSLRSRRLPIHLPARPLVEACAGHLKDCHQAAAE